MKLHRKWVVFVALPVLLILLGLILAPLLDTPDTPEAEARELLNKVRSPDPIDRLGMKLHIGDRRNPLYEVEIAKRLVALGKPAIPVLIESLNDEDPTVRACAGYALVRIGPEAVAALKAAIRRCDVHPWYTSPALACAGEPAVPVLNEALKDPDPTVRGVAAEALMLMGPDAAPAASNLCELLQDDDFKVRAAAGSALIAIGPAVESHVPAIVEALKHPDPDVRQWALHTLGMIGKPAKGSIPALIQHLNDPVEKVACQAAKALGHIGPAAKPAIPALKEALNDKDEDVRKAAATALKKIQQEKKQPTTAPTRSSQGS